MHKPQRFWRRRRRSGLSGALVQCHFPPCWNLIADDWDLGAGGKGGPSRTNAIDRDACIHFIRASVSSPTITKFLLVSAISSRRDRAAWWDDESWAMAKKFNEEIAPTYYKSKLAADEALTV